MAIVDKKSIFYGLKGKLGNIVFKTVKGKTIACSAPKRRLNKKKKNCNGNRLRQADCL